MCKEIINKHYLVISYLRFTVTQTTQEHEMLSLISCIYLRLRMQTYDTHIASWTQKSSSSPLCCSCLATTVSNTSASPCHTHEFCTVLLSAELLVPIIFGPIYINYMRTGNRDVLKSGTREAGRVTGLLLNLGATRW